MLIGVVFAVSATSKLTGRAAFVDFAASVRRMKLLPAALVRPAAAAVVAIEVGIVGLLAVPVRSAAIAGFIIATGLLTAFTAAIVSVTVRRIDTTCRCFGRSVTPLGPRHVARNGVLLTVAVLGLVAAVIGSPAAGPMLVVAGLTGLVVGALVTTFDDLMFLFE